MKRKKARVEKASVGTVAGAKYRARCNGLSDSDHEKLNDEFEQEAIANAIEALALWFEPVPLKLGSRVRLLELAVP
jgi:hypothetical protein